MMHFRRIRSEIDSRPFLDEIAAVEAAWHGATGRQEKITVQREAFDDGDEDRIHLIFDLLPRRLAGIGVARAA